MEIITDLLCYFVFGLAYALRRSLLKLNVGSMLFCVVFRGCIESYSSLSMVFKGYELAALS